MQNICSAQLQQQPPRRAAGAEAAGTGAVIEALKSRQLGSLAIDVYEQESNLFFQDRSSDIIDDDIFQRLMTFPNVLVTGHQGFFTIEALREIAAITYHNLQCFLQGKACENSVLAA